MRRTHRGPIAATRYRRDSLEVEFVELSLREISTDREDESFDRFYDLHERFLVRGLETPSEFLQFTVWQWSCAVTKSDGRHLLEQVYQALPRLVNLIKLNLQSLNLARDSATILFHFGKIIKKLAEASFVVRESSRLPLEVSNHLLSAIAKDWSADQDIFLRCVSNAILGIGYSFQNFHHHDDVTHLVENVEELLRYFIKYANSDNEWLTQNISNILLGLGYLARQGVVCNFPRIFEELYRLLMRNLSQETRGVRQQISNSLLSMGYVALSGVPVNITVSQLGRLLDNLTASLDSGDGRCIQHISNSLLGIANILRSAGESKTLTPSFSSKICQLLEFMTQSVTVRPSMINVSMTILSLGYLARCGMPFATIQRKIQDLVRIFIRGINSKAPCDPLSISNAILGLGYLAQCGCETGIDTQEAVDMLQVVTDVLRKPRVHKLPQHIANTILGLGYIAQQGVKITISAKQVVELLDIFLQIRYHQSQCTSQHISNIFLGLGYIAQQGVKLTLSGPSFEKILVLFRNNLDRNREKLGQNITNLILGLGYIAQQGVVLTLPQVFVASLTSLVALSDHDLDLPRDVSNIMLGLGYIAQQGAKLAITSVQLDTMLQAFYKHWESSPQGIRYIANLMLGLTAILDAQADDVKTTIKRHQSYLLSLFGEDLAKVDATSMSQVTMAICLAGDDLPEEMRAKLIAQQPEPQKIQTDLIKAVQQLTPAPHIEAEKLLGAWFVDLYLEIGHRRIVIELDGPQHYVDGQLCAKDQRRDQWLEAQGYEVVRFKSCNGTKKQILKFIKDMLGTPDHVADTATSGRSRTQKRRLRRNRHTAQVEMQKVAPKVHEENIDTAINLALKRLVQSPWRCGRAVVLHNREALFELLSHQLGGNLYNVNLLSELIYNCLRAPNYYGVTNLFTHQALYVADLATLATMLQTFPQREIPLDVFVDVDETPACAPRA